MTDLYLCTIKGQENVIVGIIAYSLNLKGNYEINKVGQTGAGTDCSEFIQLATNDCIRKFEMSFTKDINYQIVRASQVVYTTHLNPDLL